MRNRNHARSKAVLRAHRPILPANGAQTSNALAPSIWQLPPKKRAYTTAACETCRNRKVKCDAVRPACGYCSSARVNCVYNTCSEKETHAQAFKRKLAELSDREATYQQIFDNLRSRSEAESCEIVRRIQAGASPESILRYIKDADLLLQLALVPETRYRYVFPLVQEMPACLVRPDNPYLGSPVYEWTTSSASTDRALLPSVGTCLSETQSPYVKPFHSAEVVEPLLNSAKPSDWTQVSSDDALMRKLLAFYFSGEYHWFPPFQKDYFLQDMAAGRNGCCSPLLVNAVLAVASMAYIGIPNRYEYWNPRNLSYQFLAEAERLWDIETSGHRVRITTLQAAIPLHAAHIMHAMDTVGFSYLRHAIEMAERIGLFSPDVGGPSRDSRRTRAKEFTAWCLFNFQSLHSYVIFEPPLLRAPPAIPLPDPSVDPEWYGQIWLRYPLDAKLYTTHFPHLFRAQAEIRIITNDICLQRFAVAGSGAAMEARANEFYSRLRNWYDNLPPPLKPEKVTLPAQLMLHMNYQNIVINFYEPICATRQDLATQGGGNSPCEIWKTASRHFETLLRLYYLRHGFDNGDTFLGQPLNQLAFISLNRILTSTTTDTRDPSCSGELDATRSTLILAAKGMHDQGKSHYLCQVTLRMLKIKMGPAERDLLGKVIGDADGDDKETPQEQQVLREVRSKLAPSAVSIADSPEMHRLENLVREHMRLDGGGEEGDEDEDV